MVSSSPLLLYVYIFTSYTIHNGIVLHSLNPTILCLSSQHRERNCSSVFDCFVAVVQKLVKESGNVCYFDSTKQHIP